MTIDLHINGALQLQLKPERPIESLVLTEMEEAHAKGAVVTLRRDGDVYVVAVVQ